MAEKATIVVQSGDMDKLYSALIIGNGALAMGMEVPVMEHYTTGKMFIRYSWDLLGDIGQFEKITMTGELTAGAGDIPGQPPSPDLP